METEKQAIYRSPVARIFDKFAKQKDVTLVYGDPVELQGKSIIPVAKVHYMVGGGGGFTGTEPSSSSQGEGGGGKIAVSPLGVFEIRHDQMKFRPVIDYKFTLTMATACIVSLVWISKKNRK